MNSQFSAPKKSLGQNFLQDPNIIRKIVAAVGVRPGDTVIEIGPGRGALTEQLLPLADTLHLIEFDRELSHYWRQRSESENALVVHEQDILKFDLADLINAAPAKVKVVGNLPYNISSPVLFHLMQYASNIDVQIVMLQKEVVDRMAAQPGSKQYGRLSVMLQYQYKIENLFNVPPTAFFPPPRVDSAIARLMPLDHPDVAVENLDDFSRLVKQAFSQRRKTLRNTLKGVLDAEQIGSLNIDPGCRAEILGTREFAQLSNLFTQSQKAVI